MPTATGADGRRRIGAGGKGTTDPRRAETRRRWNRGSGGGAEPRRRPRIRPLQSRRLLVRCLPRPSTAVVAPVSFCSAFRRSPGLAPVAGLPLLSRSPACLSSGCCWLLWSSGCYWPTVCCLCAACCGDLYCLSASVHCCYVLPYLLLSIVCFCSLLAAASIHIIMSYFCYPNLCQSLGFWA